MKLSILLACLVILATGSACATSSIEKPSSYADQVESAFARAERAFEKKNYVEAMNGYNTIRNQFPYSELASLADLRLADAFFEQEQYASAVEQYRNFLRLYPVHDQAEYAAYRVALSFYEQMPGDWWFLPPSFEKDVSSARDAVRELRLFLRQYPDSAYAQQAQRQLAMARRRLADREFYVAKYYSDRDNHRAVVNRLTYLLTHYSGVGLDPQSLLLLSESYFALGDTERAIVALEDLIEAHPTSDLAREAKKRLEKYRS